MTLYRVDKLQFAAFKPTTFAAAGFSERADLQRLLRQQVGVIAPDTLVISEEFGEWDGARRRIDLLGVDKAGNLVVIELKRTDDGGHMELQSLRYAAMVSAMSFDDAVDAFEQYLAATNQLDDARSLLLKFLEWEASETESFPKDVRVVLASANFSKEITTTVLWLNDHGMNIKCVRMQPYQDGERLLVDIQQVIPLPEAEEYQIRVRDRKVAERTQNRDFTRYDVTVGSETYRDLPKRRAILQVIRALCASGVDPEDITKTIDWRTNAIYSFEGEPDLASLKERLAALLQERGNQPDTHRFFIEADEPIRANGRTYVVTKMWGMLTETAMKRLLERFPGRGISFKESV
jgi:RecB family endonuclease NucS